MNVETSIDVKHILFHPMNTTHVDNIIGLCQGLYMDNLNLGALKKF